MFGKKVTAFILIAVIGLLCGVGVWGYYSTKKPYFSIIISSYNYGHYLPQTIDSVLKSTYQDFELIVVNDGSSDKTSEILLQYKDHPQITVIEHENQGLSLSRNKAMKIAKGKYFWFVDADDWIDREALKSLYEKTKDQSPDIVSFYTGGVNAHGMFLGLGGYDMLPRKLENNPDKIFTIEDLSAGDILSYPVTSGKQLYRREFTVNNQIEFPPKTLFEDDVFFLHHLFAGARIAPLPLVLYYKRAHGQAITADKAKYYDSYIRICMYIWERTHQYPAHEEKATIVSNSYINGIPGRWRWLSKERRYKFYSDLVKWKEFLDKQPDNADWSQKRSHFYEFFASEEVAPYQPKEE